MQRRFAAYARAFIFKGFKSGAAIALLATLLILAALPASALTDSKSRFDIPAEDLGKALRDFAIQASCNISYDPTAVEHLHAPAVKGEFTASDALSLILTGTPLHAVNIDQNTIQVLDAGGTNTSPRHAMIRLFYANGSSSTNRDTQVQSDVSTGTSPTVPVTTTEEGKTPGLEEIVVTGTNITGVENKTIPLLTFDHAAIDRSGYASIGDFITSLPQNVKSSSNSPDGILSGQSGLFQQY